MNWDFMLDEYASIFQNPCRSDEQDARGLEMQKMFDRMGWYTYPPMVARQEIPPLDLWFTEETDFSPTYNIDPAMAAWLDKEED